MAPRNLDVDGDGALDFVFVRWRTGDGTVGEVGIMHGRGDGTFAAPTTYAAGPATMFIALGDFNHDERLDVATASAQGHVAGDATPVRVLRGSSDGTLLPPLAFATGATATKGLVAGDFNGDGKTDLAVGGYDWATTRIAPLALLLQQ